MRQIVVLLLVFFFKLIAQPVFAFDLSKLDPRFQALLSRGFPDLKIQKEAPLLDAIAALRDGMPVFSAIIHTKTPNALLAAGIPLNAVHGSFSTARLTIADLLKLAQSDGSFYVEPPIEEYPLNDLAAADGGAKLLHAGFVNKTAYKGQNVLVCIIDTGIDWSHKDFRSVGDARQSRILYIWDQTLTKVSGENTPAETGCNYGVEYSKAHIDNEIDGTPAGYVREKDTNGHGTHVAGTAASNGYASPDSAKYAGMAPEADLLIVKAGNSSFSQTNIIDGISYARQKAAALGKAVVINMSLGSDAGPHDGSDAKSVAIDDFCGNGRAVVLSAGNSGSNAIHISATIPAHDSCQVAFSVSAYTANPLLVHDNFIFDLWLDDGQLATARVITPNNYCVTQTSNGYTDTSTDDGVVYLDNDINTGNNDRNILMYIHDGTFYTNNPEHGTWSLHIVNPNDQAISFHGWLYDYVIGTNGVVSLPDGDSTHTLSNTASGAIIVASYAHRWRWTAANGSSYYYGTPDGSDNISSFSSIGPTRTGLQKPDVAAPGQGMASARSTDTNPDVSFLLPGQKHRIMQGTSMAAPVVTGAVAMLMQQNNSRSAADIKTLLTENADTDDYTGAVWNSVWGYGKINVFEAMVKAVNNNFSTDKQTLKYDLFNGEAVRTIQSAEKIAVRFSPSMYGMVSGCFFHPSSTFNLTGPMCCEIWTDNASGLPQTRIGQTVLLAANKILKSSWNHVDLLEAGVMVEPGRHYHAVLYSYNSSDSYNFSHDNGDPTGRSSLYSAGSWSTLTGYDFRIRPVVARRGVVVQSKLYLQGPYDPADHRMTTALSSGNHLPKTSPYSQDSRTVKAVPGDATDWVLLQLKSAPSGAALISQSVFLDKYGHIVSDDGLVDKIMLETLPNNYYVTIRHRNHFTSQSNSSHALTGNSATLYDFSTTAGQYADPNGAKELEAGVWGIYSGDVNQDGIINSRDYVNWYRSWRNNETGYRDADVNLDGLVGMEDFQQWRANASVGAKNQLP